MSEVKKPTDHQAKSENYDWTAPDGRVVTFKPFNRLPVGVFRKAAALDEMSSTFAIIEAGVVSEGGMDVVDELELGDLDTLFNAWATASGAELPQS